MYGFKSTFLFHQLSMYFYCYTSHINDHQFSIYNSWTTDKIIINVIQMYAWGTQTQKSNAYILMQAYCAIDALTWLIGESTTDHPICLNTNIYGLIVFFSTIFFTKLIFWESLLSLLFCCTWIFYCDKEQVSTLHKGLLR